jgi:hypothetical protein
MSESEHITATPPPAPGQGPPAHPAGYETSDVNLRVIVWGGIAIVAGIVLTGLVCWGLEAYYGSRQRREAEAVPVLTRAVAEQALAQQIAALPGPRLEGLQKYDTVLILRTGPRQTRVFAVGPLTRLRRAGKEVHLSDLGEGTRVAVVYREEGGVAHALRVVSPPEAAQVGEGDRELTGALVRIEPRDVAERRRLAEARRGRYEWVDEDKGIARIPVERAREAILSKALKEKWLPGRAEDKGKGEKQ